MIPRRLFALTTLTFLVAHGASGYEPRFMRSPDVSRNTILFTYEGDLWTASLNGGAATRITSHPSHEGPAKFSPDGAWIAFTGSYDDGSNVYLIPSTGGVPQRLTYIPGAAQVVAWAPDGKRVVFRSMFEQFISRDPNLYFVGTDGSAPERFPLDRGTLCSFSPDGTSILYCRRGAEEYYWKRYKGGRYVDIWMYNFTSRTFTPVSDYVGKNAYPMWVGKEMFFLSDRGNGISNLFVQDLSTKTVRPVTTYDDVDVMMPSTDGKTIVFLHDGYLHAYDIATGSVRKITLDLASDRWVSRARTINPKEYIHWVDVSNDGTTVLLEARGDVYVTPAGKGVSLNLSGTSGSREMYPRLSPDGKWVAFFSDRSGEYQLYLQKVQGGEWTPLTTTLDRTNYQLAWSPDGKKILFGNKDFSLFVLDVASRRLEKIAESNQMKNDEFYWEISDYSWSPDSRWVAYTHVQFNRNSQVFLYSLEQNARYAVTSDFFDNLNPVFDAAGGYLYYLSSRNFDVQMDFYEDNHVIGRPYQIMAVQLHAGERPPFADSVGESRISGGRTTIDVDGIERRTTPLPVEPGNYFFLRGGKHKVFWCSVPKFTEDEYEEIFKPGGNTKWSFHVFDMDQKRMVTLADRIRDYRVSTNGEYLSFRKGGDISVIAAERAFQSKETGETVDLSTLAYRVEARDEWNQIFTDTWRWYRDFFYDPGMHGRDWKKMGEFYRAYIPFLSSRAELNWVMEQMVGELCVSHTYISGGDMGTQSPPSHPLSTGWLGADLKADTTAGRYRFQTIYGPTEYNLDITNPLVRPDVDLREGDYLLAINGNEIRPPADYNRLLQVVGSQKIRITVNRKPTVEGAKSYEITPIRNNPGLRYLRWLTDNINHVLKATNGRVGYMHINAMGSGGVGEFDKFWRAFRTKEGIIIDVRRNSGGWTEYFLIDKLERRMEAYNVLKNMVPFRYPGSASSAHYVAITNEYNGSDGEAFIEHFKARKLGTVVGVPSWGGLVGILNRQGTIDNGTIEQSNNAFFGREGKWLVENHGADPDVTIDNDPASAVAGRDAQLEKAIEIVMRKMEENPFTFPAQPPYPKK